MDLVDPADSQNTNLRELSTIRMSDDHNYAGPEGVIGLVGREEDGLLLEKKEICVSDHDYAIGDSGHTSANEDIESSNPDKASESTFSPTLNENNSAITDNMAEDATLNENNSAITDNMAEDAMLNENNSAITDNMAEDATLNVSLDSRNKFIEEADSTNSGDNVSEAGDQIMDVTDDSEKLDTVNFSLNIAHSDTKLDQTDSDEKSQIQVLENEHKESVTKADVLIPVAGNNVSTELNVVMADDGSISTKVDTVMDVSNNEISTEVNTVMAVSDAKSSTEDYTFIAISNDKISTEGDTVMAVNDETGTDVNDKIFTEGDTVTDVNDKIPTEVDTVMAVNDKIPTEVDTVMAVSVPKSSTEIDTDIPVNDDDQSDSDGLVMNIGDNGDNSDSSDVCDKESEDKEIMLLSPMNDDTKKSDVQDDTSNEGILSEANNNCLLNKSVEQLKKNETKNRTGVNEETVTENENDSETTEDYSVNADAKSKSDDETISVGDESTTTVESKEMQIQASLDQSDIESEEDSQQKTSGRKRKKPAAFCEFLTNDQEIQDEVKRARKSETESDHHRGTKDEMHPGRSSVPKDLELLLEPFKLGWMRELVYRQTGNTACDTYYFAPEGRKLRSLVQVADHLEKTNSPLTCSNFSFSRRILHKPPFELVRQAGRVGLPVKKGSPSPLGKSKSSPQVKSSPQAMTPESDAMVTTPRKRGRPPKNKGPKIIMTKSRPTKYSNVEVIIERDTDEVSLSSLGVIQTMSPPSLVVTSVPTSSVSTETKSVTLSKNVVLIKQEQNIDFNISALLNSNTITSESDDHPRKKMVARKSTTPRPKMLKSDVASNKLNTSDGELSTGACSNQLCTLACPGLEGMPPTLQCFSCICLFHPQCVNYKGTGEFLCYLCQNRKKATSTGGTKSTVSIPVSMDTTPQPVQMIFQTQSPVTSLTPSLYTLKLTPNNGLVSDGLIPSLQSSSSSVIQLPGLQLQESVNAKSALRTALDKRIQSPLSVIGSTIYKPPGTNTSLICTASTSIASPVISSVVTSLPTLISAGVLSANNADLMSQAKSLKSMPAPPRLTLAPGAVPPVSTSLETSSMHPTHVSITKPTNPDIPLNAQLLTLPQAVTKRLKLSQPLALKINNIQVVVPPSCVIGSADGLKVLLPPNTFPLPTDPNQKLSVTVSNNTDPEVRKLTEPLLSTPRTPAEKSDCNKKLSPISLKKERKRKGINPASCFIKSLYGGYDCMLEIFKYLKTADILRTTRVCRTWQNIAKQHCLWRSVSLRGLTITDWDKATQFFKKVQLESLSLMGMCHSEDRNKTWHNLMCNLHNLASLTTVEFGLVPSAVLHMVCEKLTGLEVLRAEFISDATGDQMWSTPCKTYMGKFAALSQLRELKLRGIGGLTLPTFSFSGGLSDLGALKGLVSLSLTTLRSVPDSEFHFLRQSTQLKELELGDCTNWSSEIYFVLGELTNLTKLRLECGGEIPDIGLADMLQNLKNLEILELIMFQIADTVENALVQLEKLQSLVIWPDTTNDIAAIVNTNTLAAVSKLTKLKSLEWGVVSSETDKTGSGSDDKDEYIPILPQCADNSDVALLSERISIVKLTEKLSSLLPQVSIRVFNTKVVPHSQKNGSS